MPSGFQKVRFHVVDRSEEDLRAAGTRRPAYRGVGRARRLGEEALHFNTDEAAALYYLTKVLEQDERPGVRGLARTARAPVAPDARVVGKEDSPLTNTRLVRLEQTQSSIPIFGSRIIVELDQNRELVDVEADLAEIEGVSPIAALSPGEALKQIAALTGVEEASLETVQPPELMFYHDDEQDAWHLAWFFRKVPAAPADFVASAAKRKRRGLGRGLSRKLRHPLLNYLVDAHDGTVLFSYSATPLLHAPDIPSKCLGIDETDQLQEFWGRKVPGGFEMCDPRRFIQTYDLAGGDIDTDPIPTEAVRSAGNDWGDSNTAAVSAHVNATRVYNFFNGVLMRDGVDDRDGDLVSIVNCTCAAEEEPPTYHNAFWWENRMWYGREEDPSGGYRSYSRYLDVIAHELTHGVTEHTSDLMYWGQSGALNESFSDIFATIINNWYNQGPESDVESWDWEIGADLGENGLPLRDMSDPKRTGDPDHMDDYWHTTDDSGGVHTNSNIHNKAAYNVLTAQDEGGKRVFTPKEVAELYYLCLCRLSRRADFADALETLVYVANTYFAGDDEERKERIKHIQDAYEQVGITD